MPDELLLENSLAIIGNEDVVLGFKALGFKVYPLKEPQQFKAILAEVLKDKAAVCLLQDDIYNSVQDEINSYRSLPLPVFVPFSKTGQTDLLDNIIKDIKLKATGTI
ncbi:MAG: hypothetical protein AMJ78_09395 [Omnitrophica WOR_2 bacterium SM23_29]|nr:MAG: hypothetical protein AMJ78_09395 [Omnitrophica WOR_2 bacterium SM23_29]